MVKAVIFDLSEVYLKGLLGIEKILESKLNLSKESILAQLNNDDLMSLFKGKISEETYWLRVIDRTKWNIKVDELMNVVRDNFIEIEGTREIIELLKEKDIKLGLLSVHAKEWVDYCENQFGFHKLFDEICYSFHDALCKPDKLSYYSILEKLNCQSEECIFIDDSPINILGAQEIGLQGILFENSSQLKKDLRKREIL